ncbi:HrcA family transcriptional regulator [Campylobacter sputorum]|uniref:HrcA family transcriptional regulator n=1 Tax=Campylobacter sputorum TaxID=206 RepID=UPI000B79798C|nr:HrcA family transcriptional regulator [Campylobacter sputorum]ASM36978.1 heat-inducible transcription repressor [Campylobacter sputorum bv. faecalis CCUG 20703]
MKINKRDFILESIIKSYLSDNTPVGSNELCLKINESIPPSTIRVYFKKLSDEGAITQLHISGGRIPTVCAMNEYWKSILNLDELLVINDKHALSFLIKNFGIYCIIFENKKQILKDVVNYRDKFIILDFDGEELVLKFNIKIYKLLLNLVGIDLDELEKFCMQIGASELRKKINQLKTSKILFRDNEFMLFDIFKDDKFKFMLDCNILKYIKNSIYIIPNGNEGFMAIKRNVIFEDEKSTMICLGSVYNDYDKFFENLKDVA